MAAAKGVVVFSTFMLFSILFHCSGVHARRPAIYRVGDGFGWSPTTSMEVWPQGKKFYAGDILVFKYDDQLYNVVVDDKEGHDTCTVSEKSVTYDSGNDRIELVYGHNYFICGNPDDCQAGMKMVVYAEAPPPLH
ncbi:Chemocyanin precursor, putative [Ricinus communis]|uniref:Basic blue protein n=1 Tax=Ricinus communis TaxID=3988 RepID=B9SRJ0_RICCO|nr:Chemocyanin precursor, putative [Ricinus communis]|eukprot:XP_002528609.1 basic blue protein [Ricinus communis]